MGRCFTQHRPARKLPVMRSPAVCAAAISWAGPRYRRRRLLECRLTARLLRDMRDPFLSSTHPYDRRCRGRSARAHRGRVQEQKQHININNTPNFVAERYDAPCRDGQHK